MTHRRPNEDMSDAGATMPADTAPRFLANGGEMGALMRSIDWSATPLGPVDEWSLTLRTMVSFLLANRFPLLLWWGPDYIQLYNDAYRPILGTKHPRSLGQPTRECWSEIWHIIGPLIDTPFHGGPATWMEDLELEINRHGFVEETHFTVAYSPVPDDTAPRGIGGVLATVHEITEKVIAARRVRVLRDLGARALAEARTANAACATSAEILAKHGRDVPFALLYLIDADGQRAHLAGAAGVEPGLPSSSVTVDLTDASGAGPWPLLDAIRSHEVQVVRGASETAVVAVIPSTVANRPAGVLVAGVSPRLALDEQYHSFFELLTAQLATAIANARAYEEERKRAEALAELDRAKTTFFSNVSHEFRTPLALMLGPLEDVISAPADALPGRRDDLALVHRNGLRLLRLVNTLLDFSRIEAGRVEASYEPVDFAMLTADLASGFRAATDKAGLRLTVDCPPLPHPVWVDRDMWEKIVLNLVSNAFKFTFEGEIAVRVRQESEHAVLTVQDTGTGIPDAELPRLFDRFHRVEGARGRTHEGTGIGLALVQELVKLHGGMVRAESTLGEGSRFTVSVPLGVAHLPSERLQATRTLVSTALGAQPYHEEALRWLPDAARADSLADIERDLLPIAPSRTEDADRAMILFADDNADMRHYVSRLLSPGYDVQTVGDGAAALAALRARRPDLLLSDVMMPMLDGFALVRAVRADPALADMPVILLSARAGQEARVDGLDVGADDYVIKPFSARELLARIASTLTMARSRQSFERRIAADLDAMTRLHEVGVRCARAESSLDECLLHILDAAMAITGADHGNVQLVDPVTGVLTIAVQRGAETPLVRQTPLVGNNGAPLGFISTHFATHQRLTDRELRLMDLLARQTADYLERRGTEASLRHMQAQLRAIVDDAPMGVYLVDGAFRIIEVNPTAREVFGDIPDLIGRDFDEVIHILWPKEFADEVVARFHHTLATGAPYSAPEWSEDREDRGRREYYEWQIHRLPLPDGSAGVVCYFREISARVRAREAIEAARAEAEAARRRADEANRAKSEFLAVMSHELRTPLNAIAGHAQLLHMGVHGALTDAQRDALNRIERSEQYLLALINDILNYAKLEAGRVEYRLEDVPLSPVVSDVVRIVEPQLAAKSLTVGMTIPPATTALVDRDKLVQILINLLSNAVKFTEPGGRVVIEIVGRDEHPENAPADTIFLRVRDTGIGVPREKQESIFDPFVQLNQSFTRSGHGTGLGLAISRDLARGMGGGLRVRSVQGAGAAFTLALPTRNVARDDTATVDLAHSTVSD